VTHSSLPGARARGNEREADCERRLEVWPSEELNDLGRVACACRSLEDSRSWSVSRQPARGVPACPLVRRGGSVAAKVRREGGAPHLAVAPSQQHARPSAAEAGAGGPDARARRLECRGSGPYLPEVSGGAGQRRPSGCALGQPGGATQPSSATNAGKACPPAERASARMRGGRVGVSGGRGASEERLMRTGHYRLTAGSPFVPRRHRRRPRQLPARPEARTTTTGPAAAGTCRRTRAR
jgi:hypothetical protein